MPGERILVIEDEDALRDILVDVLRDVGYEVCDVSTCIDGLAKSREVFFNVVLADLRLGDGDGLETLAKIKEIWEDTCAIIMTGYASTETAVAALKQGVYDYLTKPLDMRRVKEVINRGIENQRLGVENRRLLESLKYENKKLETILQVGEGVSSILELDDLAKFVVERISRIISCERVSLMTLEEDGHLAIKAANNLDEEIIKGTRIKVGEGISGWVAKTKKPLLVTDIETHPIFGKVPDPKYKSKSFISIPIIYRDRVIGVINAIDKIPSPDASPVFSEEDLKFFSAIGHYVAIAIENARLFEEKSYLAITDSLTKLYNHRYFQEYLEGETRRIKRHPHHPLSLIMIDIDHFKRYNDTNGHPKGDIILKEVANIMKSNIREVDVAARYGGEEFALILVDTDIEGAHSLAEKIRKATEERPFPLEVSQPGGKLTISAGVASLHQRIEGKDNLIEEADKALYQAKAEGRNRVCVYKDR